MRRQQVVICSVLLILSACGHALNDIDSATYEAVSQAEGKAENAARLCLNDATHVLPEHSGNCSAVARYLKEIPSFSKCHGHFEQLPKCKSLVERYHRILDMHWRAIAISLAREHNAAGYRFYLDEKAMSRDLAKCLNDQKDEPNCVSEGADIWPKRI